MTADNWVARRKHSEITLKREAPNIWNALRAAIQDACETFREEYNAGDDTLLCKLENGKRILVAARVAARGVLQRDTPKTHVVIAFDQESSTIEVTYDKGSMSLAIEYIEDEDVVTIVDHHDGPLSSDEASQHILERILFPEQ